MRNVMMLAVCLFWVALPSTNAQQTPRERLTIFLDCSSCDQNYIKQHTREVNYTLDPLRAQVHVLVSSRWLDSGGSVYILDFIGKGSFEGDRFTLDLLMDPQNTSLERSEKINKALQAGLVVYLYQNQQENAFQLHFKSPELEDGNELSESATPSETKFWDQWIYEIFSSLSWSKESFRSTLDFRYGFRMNYVTEDWRVRFNPNFFYQERFVSSGDKDIVFVRRNDNISSAVIKSISDHWSVGLFYNWSQNTYSNIKSSHWLTPAMEFSIFPYAEAVTKEFTVAYRLGFVDQRYFEETIFLKNAEQLLRQSLEVQLNVREKWGNLNIFLSGANFFQDWQKNRLSLRADLSIRVLKGLSFNLGGDYRLVNDQISLPRGNATLEEILLGQRQLATNFQSDLNFGLRYTFGALYNNVVNTRL